MVGQRFLEDLLKLLIGLVALIIVNQLVSHFPQRWDLTEEKRYTIQQATKDLLGNLDESVYVDVYLEGALPAGFQRLQTAIEEQLQEFKIHSSNRLQYRFIDPDQAVSAEARQEFYASLVQKGIQASNVIDNQDGQRTERVIFPGAIISKGDRELGVLLLKGNKGVGPDEQLNQSIEGIEYELASAIRALSDHDRKSIALIQGQMGDDVNQWNWGKVHKLEHGHQPLSSITALAPYFNVGPFEASSSLESVNNLGFTMDGDNDYSATFGPSTRRIVDFSDLNNSRSILSTGNSGNFLSPHYDDQAEMYVNGEFRPMLIDIKKIRELKRKLVLKPE